MKDGINITAKHPTTEAKAHKNSVAASTENTEIEEKSSLTLDKIILGLVLLLPCSTISTRIIEGE